MGSNGRIVREVRPLQRSLALLFKFPALPLEFLDSLLLPLKLPRILFALFAESFALLAKSAILSKLSFPTSQQKGRDNVSRRLEFLSLFKP
jgi:hypothetical protein